MSRGHPPKAAIAEAKRYAAARGYTIIDVLARNHPFDFMISRDHYVVVVRVRRLRYRGYDTESILATCDEEIREIRGCTLARAVGRELWVRGPERTWYRYRVMPEEIRRLGCWEVQVTGRQMRSAE